MKHLPSQQDIARIRREALTNRAVEAYKFFYPTVSMALNFEAIESFGAKPNRDFIIQFTTPDIVGLTQNSDTPYGISQVDMREVGPVVVEVPAGAYMGVVDDMNFRYVTDLGLIGEEQGKGASYLLVPPGHTEPLPEGYLVRHVGTFHAAVIFRVPDPVPSHGLDELRKARVYPLSAPAPSQFFDVTGKKFYADPCVLDGTIEFWSKLKFVLDSDTLDPRLYNAYGMLVDLGLRPGVPFAPDADMTQILTDAAVKGNEQLAIAAFASTDPNRFAWTDRKWEWVVYSEGDDGYYEKDFLNLHVRERWFYQATLETPKMFMRKEGAGSIYWLGIKDDQGAYLDGSASYTLTVPGPVPAKQFWSVTLYDLDTRSEIQTEDDKAALTSLRDNLTPDADGNVVLHFGPTPPADPAAHWLRTPEGSQWFTYFRIYGPQAAAFDGSWKPSDFHRV